MHDPIIAEVRRIRRKMDKECGNDVERLADRLCVIQQEFSALVVAPVPCGRRGASAKARGAKSTPRIRHDPAT